MGSSAPLASLQFDYSLLPAQERQKGSIDPNLYEKARPAYPSLAISHAISLLGQEQGKNFNVIDLGAGTGQLTRALRPHFIPPGNKLVAIEPGDGMRQLFSKAVPGIQVLHGTADSIPYESESLDGIFIGHAFHWFAFESSLREFHRVLKPKAPVIMFWNMGNEEGAEWVKEIRAEYDKYDDGIPKHRNKEWMKIWQEDFAQENFTALESKDFKWEKSVDKQYVLNRVASKSFTATLGPTDQEELLDRVKKIMGKVSDDGILYPHITHVAWAFKK